MLSSLLLVSCEVLGSTVSDVAADVNTRIADIITATNGGATDDTATASAMFSANIGTRGTSIIGVGCSRRQRESVPYRENGLNNDRDTAQCQYMAGRTRRCLCPWIHEGRARPWWGACHSWA